jgi:hypothetical protein
MQTLFSCQQKVTMQNLPYMLKFFRMGILDLFIIKILHFSYYFGSLDFSIDW